MNKVRFDKWLLEADPVATRKASGNAGPPCRCLYCRNFRQAVAGNSFFEELGIDPALPALLSDFPTEDPEMRLYIGHYEITGRLLEGPEATEWEEAATSAAWDFTIGFLRAENGLQLEFETVLPWLMDEPQED